ncbi:peptidase [Streptococcus sp. H49]|uniref:peptidase n=1 Tax=Streptococcus huangxiaojuni TaxID=3237239 RepID=UPI0034A2D1C1
MKNNKSEVIYLILSIITIALAGGIYLVFGNNSSTNQANFTSQDTKVTAEKKAEKLVSRLEDKQTQEDLEAAQKAVDKVEEEKTKASLQKRIEAVETELSAQEGAEKAVAAAEANQTLENLHAAQDAVNIVSNPERKAALQKRIEAVSAALAAIGLN